MTGGKPPIALERLLRSSELTHDETYRLLADEYTRATLAVLLDEETTTVDDLLEDVIDCLDADDAECAEFVRTVRLSLVHVVLPKLAAHDLLAYDRLEGAVSATLPEVNAGQTTESVVSPGRS